MGVAEVGVAGSRDNRGEGSRGGGSRGGDSRG